MSYSRSTCSNQNVVLMMVDIKRLMRYVDDPNEPPSHAAHKPGELLVQEAETKKACTKAS